MRCSYVHGDAATASEEKTVASVWKRSVPLIICSRVIGPIEYARPLTLTPRCVCPSVSNGREYFASPSRASGRKYVGSTFEVYAFAPLSWNVVPDALAF